MESLSERSLKERLKQGSMTVEAALLMTVMIPVLASLIYAGFFVNDCGVAQGVVSELAVTASLKRLETDPGAVVGQRAGEIWRGRTLGLSAASCSAACSEKESSAAFSGSFPVPGLVRSFLGGDLGVSASWSRKLLEPSRLIWTVKGAQDLAAGMKE